MGVEYSIMATEKQIHYLWTMCSKIEYPLPYTREALKELTKIQIGDLINEVREKYDDWNFQQKQFKEEGLTHIQRES